MAYQRETCAVWSARGFTDTCLEKTMVVLETVPEDADAYLLGGFPQPPWLGRKELHRSHRSRLIAESPAHDARLFPGVADDLDDVRPVATS